MAPQANCENDLILVKCAGPVSSVWYDTIKWILLSNFTLLGGYSYTFSAATIDLTHCCLVGRWHLCHRWRYFHQERRRESNQVAKQKTRPMALLGERQR